MALDSILEVPKEKPAPAVGKARILATVFNEPGRLRFLWTEGRNKIPKNSFALVHLQLTGGWHSDRTEEVMVSPGSVSAPRGENGKRTIGD